MKFNFIIIPLIIFATSYFGRRYTRQGIGSWYLNLKKPNWTPAGNTIGQIWTFLYLLTGFAVLWFWNVPYFRFWHLIVGGILLINAFLNVYWSKLFFVDHNLQQAYKEMILLNITTIVAAILMFPFSAIASLLMLPYIIWVGIATKLTKEIIQLNTGVEK